MTGGGLRPGDVLGDNRLDELAGQGGMGVVYRATQIDLEREVAIKVISPALAADPEFRARFKREVRLLATVEHPHVIPIHQAGETDGQLYLSMRWIDGQDLGQQISAANGLDPDRALRILGQIAGALDAVHAHGLVHRDIKPANVLIEDRPGGEHAYLTDFGAGRQLDVTSKMTRTGQWLGTVDYVAPEILAGEAPTARSDVYALGCVLYEALAASPPFHRDTPFATMLAHQGDAPPSLRARRPHLPPALDAVIARALAKDPDQRFPSGQRLLQAAGDALTPMLGQQTAPSGLTAADPRGLRRLRAVWHRRRSVAVLATVLVAAAIVTAVLSLGTDSPPAGPAPKELASAAAVARTTLIPLDAAAPGAVAADSRKAYVLDESGAAVVVVDHISRRRLARIVLPATPLSLGADPDSERKLWVGLADNRLVLIDPVDNTLIGKPLRLPIKPDDVVITSRGLLVVAQHKPLKLVRVDRDRRRLVGRVVTPGGTSPRVIGTGGDILVLLTRPSRLATFDRDLRRTEELRLGDSDPRDMAQAYSGARGPNVWITDYAGGRVLRADHIYGTLSPPVHVGGNPIAIAVEERSVWVTSKRDGTVTRIERSSGRPYSPPVHVDGLIGPIAPRSGPEYGAWVPTAGGLVELEKPDPPY